MKLNLTKKATVGEEKAPAPESAGIGVVTFAEDVGGGSGPKATKYPDHPLRRAAVEAQQTSEESEESDRFDVEGSTSKLPRKHTPLPRHGSESSLSLISKRYDLDGKGRLDETERMMRAYDVKNAGHLDMREVYKIVQELREQQRELSRERKTILDMKRVIIFLCVFTIVLTVAMLGVSFAAARLAKDTTVTSSHALADKATGETLSVYETAKTCPFYYDLNETTPEPEADDDDDEDGEAAEEGGSEDGGGRRRAASRQGRRERRLFSFSHPTVNKELSRRVQEHHHMMMEEEQEQQQEQEDERKLRAINRNRNRGFGSRIGGGNSARNGNNVRSGFSKCDVYEGDIDYATYKSMQLSARNGHDKFDLVFESKGLYYKRSLPIQAMMINEEREETVLEARMEIGCNSNGINCGPIQSTYVFSDCGCRKLEGYASRAKARSKRRGGSGTSGSSISARSSSSDNCPSDEERKCTMYSCGDDRRDGFDDDDESASDTPTVWNDGK